MKIYTRTGDDGSTGLFDGQRRPKDNLRIEAYGAVDEANAAIGLAAAMCDHADLAEMLEALMARLFDVGADLATPPDGDPRAGERITRMSESDSAEVEGWIDRIESENEPLRTFVLPGGCELAARLHVARTTMRRAERRVVTLSAAQPVGAPVLSYLNRVSDLLFAMSRLANRRAGVPDTPWRARGGDSGGSD
jgi:cob(I)alamin adenosyltransferase